MRPRRAWQAALALPFSGVMSEEQVDYVCEQLVRLGHVGTRVIIPVHMGGPML